MARVLWVVPVVTAGLGTWQVQRWQWKQDLKAQRAAGLAAEPLPLRAADVRAMATAAARNEADDPHRDDDGTTSAAAVADAAAGAVAPPAWRRVRLRGRWMDSPEGHMALVPRVHEGALGAHVVSALKLDADADADADGGEGDVVVLVNRGWVPKDVGEAVVAGDEAAVASLSAPDREGDGVVQVDAVVRRVQKPGRHTPDNRPQTRQWYWVDEAAMSEAVAGDQNGEEAARKVVVAPFSVDSLLARERPPLGGLSPPELPDNHVEYAVTWYSLCIATTIMCLSMARRGRTPTPPRRHA